MARDSIDKAERLAAALRDNLRRRKAQTRERQVDAPLAEPISPAEPPSRD